MSYPAPPDERITWKTRFLRFATWWTGATVNTRFWTSRNGEVVGYDEFGNTYYRSIGGRIDPALGFDRRWVIYRGESEGSATPPGWYGWLHHQTDELADAVRLRAARLGKALPAQHDGNARRLPPAGLHAQGRHAAPHGRRLRRLDPRLGRVRADVLAEGRDVAGPSYRHKRGRQQRRGRGSPRHHERASILAASRNIPLGAGLLALAALLSAAAPARADKIKNGTAVFSGLDKITGRIISFKAAMGETVQFGSLQVTARACYTRPAKEAPQTDTFVEIDEVSTKREFKRVFSGWMFAASPGLHGLEHPIYDIWLTSCETPGDTIVDAPQTADADANAVASAPADGVPAAPGTAAPAGSTVPAPPATAAAPKPRPKRVARPAPRPEPAEAPRQEPTQRFFPTSQYPADLPPHDPAGNGR